jgi:uncharacterized membrane protein YcgQ (UPF0703/DUF1980 family)
MKSFFRMTQAIVEAALLGALGLRFFYLIWSGKVLYYVSPRWLTLLAIGWFLITALCIFQLVRRSGHAQKRPGFFLLECLMGLWLIMLPIRPLETRNRIADKLSASAPMTSETLPADTSAYHMKDWYLYFISGSPRPELEGKAFHASGYIAGYDAAGKTVELGRQVVTCCAADSFLTSLTVEPSEADSAKLMSDAWYDVSGHWHQAQDGSWRIKADTFEPISVPSDPYVYP